MLWRWIRRFRVRVLPFFPLDESALDPDPAAMFDRWYREAVDAGLYLPEAMVLSTVDSQGQPSSRAVLLKGHSARGLEFYTNAGSAKARDLADHPQCSVLFHWAPLHRQIRVQGRVTELTDAEIDAYFASRPRGSQIGAWASHQSHPLKNRAELEAAVREYEAKFSDGPVPRPPHWTGYRITPARYEFWQGQASRLHDRFVYEPADSGWCITRLAP